MKTRVLLLVLLVIAGKLLYDLGAPAPAPLPGSAPGVARSAPQAREEAEPRLRLAGAMGVIGRLRRGVGVLGAHAVEPAVQGILGGHFEDLSRLETAAREVESQPRRKRAEGAVRRIQELDSLAVARLHSGNPVSALKFAMQADGLVATLRDEWTEQRLLR